MSTLKKALEAKLASKPEVRIPNALKNSRYHLTTSELGNPTTFTNTQSGQNIHLYKSSKVNPAIVKRMLGTSRRRKTRKTRKSRK